MDKKYTDRDGNAWILWLIDRCYATVVAVVGTSVGTGEGTCYAGTPAQCRAWLKKKGCRL